MFAGTIDHLDNYMILPRVFVQELEWARMEDFSEYTKGSYPRDGEIFFNFEHYDTKPYEDTFWEGHQKFIDIHYIIAGGERLDVAKIHTLTPIEGEADKDFYAFEGPSQRQLQLLPGDFVICYPEDIHRTGISYGSFDEVTKIIFKIPVALLEKA